MRYGVAGFAGENQMNRRDFLRSFVQAVALVGAVKLGLGNVAALKVPSQGGYSVKIVRLRGKDAERAIVNGPIVTVLPKSLRFDQVFYAIPNN
jgi:hypothetical protein